jgi:AcrR family transcriptional regulator
VAIRTIFLIAQECSRGEREGWRDLVRQYGGVARRLLNHYFPSLEPDIDTHLLGVFQRARGQDNEWFRQVAFTNEREFSMAFRDLLFAYGREAARIPVPQLSLEQVRSIMQDLPVLEREMLWLFIKGYDATQVGATILNAEATAQSTKQLADQRLAQVLPGTSPDAFNISARVLIEAAEKARTPECLALKTFNNIVNGQISWRERELAEEHINSCFYCLDRFTSFQEMIRLHNDTAALPEPAIEAVLERLNVPAAKPRGLLARLFSGG